MTQIFFQMFLDQLYLVTDSCQTSHDNCKRLVYITIFYLMCCNLGHLQ